MLASTSIRSRWITTALFGITLFSIADATLSPRPAHASNPSANYTVASKLEFFPDEAKATSIVIHGSFFFYQNGGTYGAPACGYMYFACPAGSETMCRMQWADLKGSIGQPYCMGFGAQNMVSKATLRAAGTPLGNNPDTWDLGIGVSSGSYVGGQCAPAQALKCGLPATPDMAGTVDPTPDLAMAVVNPPILPKDDSKLAGGCAVAGAQGAAGGALFAFATAMAALVRRRRR